MLLLITGPPVSPSFPPSLHLSLHSVLAFTPLCLRPGRAEGRGGHSRWTDSELQRREDRSGSRGEESRRGEEEKGKDRRRGEGKGEVRKGEEEEDRGKSR